MLALLPPVLLAQNRLPEAGRQRYDSVLTEVRDSLAGVLAAKWEFSRDLKKAGAETVLARAAALRVRCAGAAVTIRRAPAKLDAYSSFLGAPTLQRLRALTAAGERLRATLRDECEAGFAGSSAGILADSLRAWGPYRAEQVEKAIVNYERTATALAEAVGVRLEPK